MYQGLRISRRGLALVLALFCVPLFVGLDREDVRDDEAIYSFSVDRILETGDWLEPKSIPFEDRAFLEKPPLKFWIVAAPIRFGLLPHNEFGLRFWDAVFGAASFIYVFLIGSRMLGAICGAVSVLVLFVHEPLLFYHGLRSNNMDAAVVLAYCGGVWHFLAWSSATTRRGRWGHAIAVGLCFVLGFMTKFVAVVFLPMVLGCAVLLVPEYRRRFTQDWRIWGITAAMASLLIAPWFLWAWQRHGDLFWEAIFGAAVYTRMTLYLDPAHVQPWHFYAAAIYTWLSRSGSLLLAGAGLFALTVQTIRMRWPEGTVVLLWLILPLIVISAGTSKLYHYAYPFLPPLGLAAGYGAALTLLIAPVPFKRAGARARAYAAQRAPRAMTLVHHPAVRGVLLTIAAAGLALATATLMYGPVRINFGSQVFRSSGILRPLVIAVAAGLLAGVGLSAARVVVAMLVLSTMPLPAYRSALDRMRTVNAPLRITRDCILALQSQHRGMARGLYVDVPLLNLPYPHYYYFRTIRPWLRADTPSPPRIGQYLNDPDHRRPVLVWEPTYQEYRREQTASGAAAAYVSPPLLIVKQVVDDVFMVLPGPYAACSAEASPVNGSAG